MPQGKPAGVRCVQLDADLRCRLFGLPERPAVCGQLRPERAMCGPRDDGGQHAMRWLTALEAARQVTRLQPAPVQDEVPEAGQKRRWWGRQ